MWRRKREEGREREMEKKIFGWRLNLFNNCTYYSVSHRFESYTLICYIETFSVYFLFLFYFFFFSHSRAVFCSAGKDINAQAHMVQHVLELFVLSAKYSIQIVWRFFFLFFWKFCLVVVVVVVCYLFLLCVYHALLMRVYFHFIFV